jgi:hypothetical protein
MKRISIFTALALAIFAGQAYAETIRGTVSSVDPDGKSIQVSRVSENGSGSEDVKVSLKDDTRLNGVTTASELLSGQSVSVEAEQNFFTRAWSADSIDTDAAASEAPTTDASVNAEVTGVDTRATATDPNASAGSTAPESVSEPAPPTHDATTRTDTVYDAVPATSGSNVEPADASAVVADDVHPAGTTAVESASVGADATPTTTAADQPTASQAATV